MKRLNIRLMRLIKQSKGQFASISIMIILALIIYVSMNMVAKNLYNSIYQYYDETNFADAFVQVVKIPRAGIDKLLAIEGVELAQGRISEDVPLKVEDSNEKVRIRITSIPEEEIVLNDIYIIEGEYIDKDNHGAVLQQFTDARGLKPGDTIKPFINGKVYPITISAIAGNPEYIYLMENEEALIPAPEKFGVVYVKEQFARTVLGYQGSYNEILIRIKSDYHYKIDSILDEVEDALEKYGVKSITKRENQLSHSLMMQEVDQLEMMSAAITIMFLGIAALIINIMLSRTVKNDRIAIGVLKAIGYSNKSIMWHYTKFSLAIGVVGSTLGMLLSIPVTSFYTNMYIMYMNIPLFGMKLYKMYFVYGILITSIFCILSGLMGAKNVLKIMPASAMQPEAPKTAHRILLEKVSFIWKRISFSWKMVIRNSLRKKKRAAFLVLGVSLTYAMILVTVFMSTVWTNIFRIHYGEFQTMEYGVDYSKFMDKNIVVELSKIIEIDKIESKTEIPFELELGWKKKTVSVIGLEKNTSFYNFKTTKGEEVELLDKGIYLADRLAETLGAKKGDLILLNSFLPNGKDVYIEVKGIVEQYLGTNAYMTMETLNNIIGEKNLVTGALINSKDQVTEKLRDIKYVKQAQSVGEMQEIFEEYMDMMIYSVGVMMFFGGILGFTTVYNINVISISERLMEFSSLRVLGFDKKEISRMIRRENMVLASIGIFVGMPIGYYMCKGLIDSLTMDMLTIPLDIEISSYFITAIATAFFIIMAQLATVRKIHRLNFLEALKNRTT